MKRIINFFRKKDDKNSYHFSSIGENTTIPNTLDCVGDNNISIGKNVYIGPRCTFYSTRAKLIIGNHVMFGPEVMIITGDHRFDVKGKLMDDPAVKKKVGN